MIRECLSKVSLQTKAVFDINRSDIKKASIFIEAFNLFFMPFVLQALFSLLFSMLS
jgi:hypothetical protein